MPRLYEMTWEGPPNFRWSRMYKGQRYRVTCAQLNAMVWTKEGSAKLANEWWRQKLTELEGPTVKERLVQKMTEDEWSLIETIARGNIAQAALEASMVDGADQQASIILDQAADGIVANVKTLTDEQKLDLLGDLHGTLIGKPVQKDLSAEFQAERFLAIEQARGTAPGTFGDLSYYIHKILQGSAPTLSKEMDVRTINQTTVGDFYLWLRNNSNQSATVQRKIWNYFRRFVRFLWSGGLIALPTNLNEKTFSFGNTAKKIKTYPIEQIREMLACLPDRLRLYALLALNCGMLGVDMAQLRKDEYQNGRIRRKRSKTRKGENVPEVEYLLWDETKGLLNKYPSSHPNLVLTSKTGTPLWETRIENGRKRKYDLVALQWHRGRGEKRANKPTITLKALRSVSATLLESHPVYGRYKSHFLGHSPLSVADRHYAAPSQDLFDEAILWLRVQVLGG